MGTMMEFPGGARAHKMALILVEIGAEVMWDPRCPELVWTSLSEDEVKKIEAENPGTDEAWISAPKIDTPPRGSSS